MLKDITLGQYYPSESIVHKLDPRTKILLTFLFIIAVFLIKSLYGFVVMAILTIILTKVAKIPLIVMVKGLKPLLLIMIFTSVINLFMTDGEIIWQFYFLKLTKEGIYLSAFMLIRVVFLVTGSSFLTYTTSPIAMTSGIESLMKPLKKLKFPAHEIAMMMSIALRFIPTLIEETDKIMSAQKARGANLSEGSLIKRAKALVPILIPLFISAFRRADELAVAMESRCYNGGENRTKLKELRFEKKDLFAVLIFILGCGAVISVNLILVR